MTIIIPIVAVTVIGLLCGVVLSVASTVMAVEVDERVEQVRECLPGANCGACGYTGCDGYAQAVVNGAKTNLCVPGAAATAKSVAEVMGVEVEDIVAQVAIVSCRGDCEHTHTAYDYQGIDSCRGAKLLFGGEGACIYGCFGRGDCAKTCPNDAISLADGVASIDPTVCTGCGMCAKVCPNEVIKVVAAASQVAVVCNNKEPGVGARKACSNACIACRRCERGCPEGAITVRNNLASINYAKCSNCGHCAEECPTGAVLLRKMCSMQ